MDNEWDNVVPHFSIDKVPEQEFSLDLFVQSNSSNIFEFNVVNQNIAFETVEPVQASEFFVLAQPSGIDYGTSNICTAKIDDTFALENLIQVPQSDAVLFPEVAGPESFELDIGPHHALDDLSMDNFVRSSIISSSEFQLDAVEMSRKTTAAEFKCVAETEFSIGHFPKSNVEFLSEHSIKTDARNQNYFSMDDIETTDVPTFSISDIQPKMEYLEIAPKMTKNKMENKKQKEPKLVSSEIGHSSSQSRSTIVMNEKSKGDNKTNKNIIQRYENCLALIPLRDQEYFKSQLALADDTHIRLHFCIPTYLAKILKQEQGQKMKALQKEAQGTFCSLGESKGDTVVLDLNGKVASTKYALDFLEKELYENYCIVTTKFNEYLSILHIHKECTKQIENKFDVRVNIEKKLVQPTETTKSKKGMTRSQSGMEFWRKVVPPAEKNGKQHPVNVQKVAKVIPTALSFCGNKRNVQLAEQNLMEYLEKIFLKNSIEVTECQARGIKNQRKKFVEEFKCDLSFKYPAWNEENIRLTMIGNVDTMNAVVARVKSIMDNHLSFTMQIKDDYSKNLVVGQKGSNAKLIQEKSGAILHIDLYNCLTLIGNAKGIEIAKEMIKDALAKRYINLK